MWLQQVNCIIQEGAPKSSKRLGNIAINSDVNLSVNKPGGTWSCLPTRRCLLRRSPWWRRCGRSCTWSKSSGSHQLPAPRAATKIEKIFVSTVAIWILKKYSVCLLNDPLSHMNCFKTSLDHFIQTYLFTYFWILNKMVLYSDDIWNLNHLN